MSDDSTYSSPPNVGHFATVADLARRSGAEPPRDEGHGGHLILLRAGRELYTYEEWLNCKAFLDSCQQQLHAIAMARTQTVADRNSRGEINLGELNREVAAISFWLMKSTMTLCRCQPGERDLPEIPGWKDQEREALGVDVTWRCAFKVAAPVTASVGVAAATAGGIMLIPGAVTAEVAARWAVPLLIIGGTATIMSIVSAALAADPPDADFADLPVVDVKPRFDVDLSDLPQDAQNALTTLIDLVAEQAAVGFALLTAVQRSWGADVAGDQEASARQLDAAAELAERLAAAVEHQAAARTDLVAAVRADVPSLIITQADLLEHVLPWVVEGPDETFVNVVNHYAGGNQDADYQWWLMAAQIFNGAMPGEWVLPDELNPPALALIEAREAAYLRSIAEVWRG